MVAKVTMVQYTDYAIESANALHDPRALHVADDVPPRPFPTRLREHRPNAGLVMANLTHVLIQFDEAFWPDVPRFLAADDAHPGQTGYFVEFQNLDYLVPGSKTLLSFLGDPWSSAFEALDDAAAQAALLARVRDLSPAAASGKEPTAFFMSRWGYDALAGGAYSGLVGPGFDDDANAKVSRPLKDDAGDERVYFAGEHTCPNLSGCAWRGEPRPSGNQAAQGLPHFFRDMSHRRRTCRSPQVHARCAHLGPAARVGAHTQGLRHRARRRGQQPVRVLAVLATALGRSGRALMMMN